MEKTSKPYPPFFIIACFFLAAGMVSLGLSFILRLEPDTFKGLLYISLALLAFGTGEIINHPKQRLMVPDPGNDAPALQIYRRRNVCSLGNLFDIAALLLFFIGLAAFFYPAE